MRLRLLARCNWLRTLCIWLRIATFAGAWLFNAIGTSATQNSFDH